jgi:hypothetical protein
MRRRCSIRKIKPNLSEPQLFLEWIAANREKNDLDEAMLSYPSTEVLVADGKDGRYPHVMMPVHPVFVMDSLAPNPAATAGQIALALRKMTDIVEWESRKLGYGEIWFVASEPSIARFAEEQDSFVEVKSRVFKMKIDEGVI